MTRTTATIFLVALAGIGFAGPVAAQRVLIDVTMEVVDDVAGIDAAVLQLEPLDGGAQAAGEEDDSAEAPAGEAEADRAGNDGGEA